PKSNEISRRLSTENKKSISKKFEKPKCAPTSKSSEQIKHDNQVDDADNQTLSIKPIRSVFPPHDADSEKGLVDSFKEARSSILLEGVTEKHKLDDSVDLTTKLDKVIAQEHGNCGDKLMLNHDLLVSTDDQEEQACINESRKRSSHHGNVDQESEKRQEFKMSKSWKTSGKRTLIEKNDRKGLGVSSQLFKEKGVVSQASRCIKRAPGHQGRSHSEIEKGTSVKNADENQNREEEKHRRESNARQQVGPSGVQDPNATQNDHLSGHNPCANKHAQLSTASKSLNKMNTLAADESNLVRTGSPTPDPPIFSGNGTFERIVPPGFAAGPNYAFSLHHSAGWLEE
ncbi:PHD finger-containing protein, partial [Trifolium medium]|nr:PHD finger-containing protein [Trifolium medium]